MKKIAVLADSGCQIEITGDHPGIYIAPLCITMKQKTYLDQLEVTSIDVFKTMEKENLIVQTSQPSTGEMLKAVEKIKEDGYEEIIGIPIATGLSSTLNGMKVACDMVGLPITLVDSKGTARNQRELVYKARELVEAGKDVDYIKGVLEDMVEHSGTVIMVPNLDHLKKGGRITPAVALLAGMLKIVPVMELNYKLGGKIDTLTKVRTVKKAAKSLIDRAIEKGADASTYAFAIEHVLCEKEANDLKDYLISQIGECDVVVRELPAVVGAHMGVGGIGVQYIKVKK
ncbi:DegV family protein [Kandleria sp.]|uniref:DegV family protein n=1 Tax=Kandleria sp. TaxID=2774291 RepID=UPI001B6D4F9A|nr:DegV family protein [Kandleria sp.]MBP3276029.1 DegV family protein [Kandleria sp.]